MTPLFFSKRCYVHWKVSISQKLSNLLLIFFCRETTMVLDKVQLLKLRSSLTISKSINRTSSFSWVPISQQHLVFFRGLLFDFFLSSVHFLCNEGKLQYRTAMCKAHEKLDRLLVPCEVHIFIYNPVFSN